MENNEITKKVRITKKNQKVAITLAAIFGCIGAHKFYLGQTIQGLLYITILWFVIPLIIGYIEIFNYVLFADDVFGERYEKLIMMWFATPFLVGFADSLKYFLMSKSTFERKYCKLIMEDV